MSRNGVIAIKKDVENEKKHTPDLAVKKETSVSTLANKNNLDKTSSINNLNYKTKIKTENENTSIKTFNNIFSSQGSKLKPRLEEQSFQQTSNTINQFKIPKIKQENSHGDVKIEIQIDSLKNADTSNAKKSKDFHKIVRFF